MNPNTTVYFMAEQQRQELFNQKLARASMTAGTRTPRSVASISTSIVSQIIRGTGSRALAMLGKSKSATVHPRNAVTVN